MFQMTIHFEKFCWKMNENENEKSNQIYNV